MGVQHGCGVEVKPGVLWGATVRVGRWERGLFSEELGCHDAEAPAQVRAHALQGRLRG